MKIPHHIIHTPEFINCNNLTETKLPKGHTRQERIEEIKEMAKKYRDVPGMFLYASIRIEQLDGFSNGLYQDWVSTLNKIIKKGYQELEGKGVVDNTIPEDELPKDVHGNKADLETHSKSPEHKLLEKQICGLTNAPDFTMSEKDHTTFLQVVKGMTFEAGTSEMALAFITVAIMDKDKFIIERNNREKDFRVLIRIINYIYRHAFESKSTLLLLVEALDTYTDISDIDFRHGIINKDSSFNEVLELIRKPVTTGGIGPFTLQKTE